MKDSVVFLDYVRCATILLLLVLVKDFIVFFFLYVIIISQNGNVYNHFTERIYRTMA